MIGKQKGYGTCNSRNRRKGEERGMKIEMQSRNTKGYLKGSGEASPPHICISPAQLRLAGSRSWREGFPIRPAHSIERSGS